MESYQIVEWGAPLARREAPTPVPKGTEVLLRIDACGVCHSDLHIWDGYFDLGDDNKITLAERGVELPFTMGHEIVGEVAALGPDAEDVDIGDRRIAYPWIGCGDCAACQRGEELLCMTPRTLGTRRHGGYADHVIVPHPRYLVDYTGVPAELACTYACSGLTAYSALRKAAHLNDDDYLLIIGAGGVGLNAVHFAPAVVKGKVIVADVDGTKLGAARQAGAVETIDNSQPDAAAKILEITGGGAAAALDFVGMPATMKLGIDGLRKGGTLVSVGLYGGSLPLSTVMLPFKMLNMHGSYVGTLDEMHDLMALVKAGDVPPLPIDARPLDQANSALNDLRAGKVLGRVVLKP